MRKKIKFNKLIGRNYTIDVKMFVFDWMRKNGLSICTCSGVREDILFCSVRYNKEDVGLYDMYFDAMFARAIYGSDEHIWRCKNYISERCYKYFDIPVCSSSGLYHPTAYLRRIHECTGKLLKKEFTYQHDDTDLTEPRILYLYLTTKGNGWYLVYNYTFKECSGSVWEVTIHQNDNEPIIEFLDRCYNALIQRVQSSAVTQILGIF